MAASALVSTEWLAAQLTAPDLQVLDASWHMPAAKRNPGGEFLASHIPGARFFDIDAISDRSSPLPHMVPPPDQFAAQMQALGVGDQTRVVVYDVHGLMTAARAWWLLRLFGHEQVFVLDGGLPKWQAEGRPVVADAPAPPPPVAFTPRLNLHLIRDHGQVAQALAAAHQVVDARAADRFEGRAPEPRPELASGHMPGSRNLPWSELVDPVTKQVRAPADIRARFQAAGIDLSRPLIASCGSGVTACVLAFGAYLNGAENVAVYDGSWSEWAAVPGARIAAGPAA